MAYKCSRCHANFATRQELGGHLSKGLVCTPVDEPLLSAASAADASSNDDVPVPAAAVSSSNDELGSDGHRELSRMATTNELLQRPCADKSKHRVVPTSQKPGSLAGDADESNSFKLFETQEAFKDYCNDVRKLYSDDFWRVFSSVHEEKIVMIDKVLKACKDVYVPNRCKRFETSVRELRKKMVATSGDFNQHLLHEIDIDLRGFGLPNVTVLKFRFVNPLWAWTVAANDMIAAGHTMHFVAKTMLHEQTGEQLYGQSVVFGDKLRLAAALTPEGGKPGLFGISFDGGESGVSSRTVIPVCVSCLNFDGADPLACGLVGFVPAIEVPKLFKDKFNKLYLRAKTFVMQRCIGAVIDELEAVARDGFVVDLGGRRTRVHPWLAAVRVDSKERKTYYGLKSDRCAHTNYLTHSHTYTLTLVSVANETNFVQIHT